VLRFSSDHLYHGEYFSVAIKEEAFWAAVPVWTLQREISLIFLGKWASIAVLKLTA
jgi:hypothetical protein